MCKIFGKQELSGIIPGQQDELKGKTDNETNLPASTSSQLETMSSESKITADSNVGSETQKKNFIAI